ncbi:OmpA family protein [Hymenobacter sp. BT683]|uniref:OmpA family protein n=1 Tax=Hymenobacter jeongseonensis TaxID=2791027 RepID=A0ABS0IL27_9BACT|nr:PA14 domain-containing protein [Hymenobacter jeongseonensis]MBF9239079.1 OmpA family protein [Hymenobacter jeongseonensis]
MAWVNYWGLRGPLLRGLLLAVLLPVLPARAQTQIVGNGIKGDYYEGTNFEKFVLSRRDPTLAFDWGHRPPALGLPTEYFSVRWTGWLVPPASGKYIFHVSVDDGIRIWVNNRLIMDEWRPQPVSNFTTSLELKGGQPYHLRVEYYQDILDTRAVVTWERPDAPLGPPPASWRNLWGATAETPGPSPIPTRYLFRENPKAVAARTVPPLPPAKEPKAPLGQAKALASAPVQRPQPPTKVVVKPVGRPIAKPVAKATVKPAARPAYAAVRQAPVLAASDSGSTAQLAALSIGETVTLPELYFNQGKAQLLPAARTALDGLAAALRARPALRFEVQGHTDNVGNAELNRQLSQQRAEAVCLYLAAHGVAAGQLQPKGYGGTQPVADNADPAQRPLNRRVVLRRL